MPPPDGSGGFDAPEISVPWEAALAVLAVAILVVGFIVLRRLRLAYGARGRSNVVGGHVDDDVPEAVDELRQAVQSASAALAREEAAGHDAVIEAWQTLETAASASGVPRLPSQTPSEFTAQLLRRHHADAAATTRLRDLYHRARFSPQPRISPTDVRRAREALSTILDTLDAPERADPERVDVP